MRFKVGSVSVDLIDGDRICKRTLERGPFEPNSLKAWSEMVKPKQLAVDVGAYTGLYAIAAAKLGAKVVALEPLFSVSRRLVQNVIANDCRVTVIKAAASDFNGEADLAFNRAPLTAGASLIKPGKNKETVTVVSLDALHLSDVCVVKIDVERNEPAVLRGAKELLARWRPAILVECLTGMRDAILAELPGYRLVDVLDRRNLLLMPA